MTQGYPGKTTPLQKAFQVILINLHGIIEALQLSADVQRMKQLMWLNEQVTM